MQNELICAQAPSNIALIKYMGKKDSSLNVPENPSLSLTLNGLCSFAEISWVAGSPGSSTWVRELPVSIPGPAQVPSLKEDGIQRVLRHVERVRLAMPEILKRVGLHSVEQNKSFELRTANTFPASSGIASSASSFAAVTLATAAACAEDLIQFERALNVDPAFRRSLAKLSRVGSGSSCRSFEGPWVYWEGEDAKAIEGVQIPRLAHFVILFETTSKKVSSSQAHQLIRTSPLWDSRVKRVEDRVSLALLALREKNWANLTKLAWAETWEMHSLFHTCADPFSYWVPETMRALQWFSPYMKSESPPLVTLDAGPNIHILTEFSQQALWRERLRDTFPQSIILEDEQGSGARLLGVK